MVADAVARYESAVRLWAGLTLEQQLVAGRMSRASGRCGSWVGATTARWVLLMCQS